MRSSGKNEIAGMARPCDLRSAVPWDYRSLFEELVGEPEAARAKAAS
jgi:hypothetical protein